MMFRNAMPESDGRSDLDSFGLALFAFGSNPLNGGKTLGILQWRPSFLRKTAGPFARDALAEFMQRRKRLSGSALRRAAAPDLDLRAGRGGKIRPRWNQSNIALLALDSGPTLAVPSQ
jgi:hypothetical protein